MSSNKTMTRRTFLRQPLDVAGGIAAAVASASVTAAEFGYSIPERDVNGVVRKGMADDLYIDLALMNLINEQFAEELVKDFKVGDQPLVHFSKDLSLVIIDFKGDKKTHPSRAFQLVPELSLMVDPATGAKLMAFREVNIDDAQAHIGDANPAKLATVTHELRIVCPGRSESKDPLGKADTQAVTAIFNGQASPQMAAIKTQIASGYQEYREQNKGLTISILGHSLGAANALQAKKSLEDLQIPVERTTLFEPFGAVLAAHYLTENVQDVEKLAAHVNSVRADPPTANAQWRLGNSTVNNKEFGEATYIIDHENDEWPRDPQLYGRAAGAALGVLGGAAAGYAVSTIGAMAKNVAPSRVQRFIPTRRDALIVGGAAVGMPLTAEVGSKLDQATWHNDSHDAGANAVLLHQKGNQALTACKKAGRLVTVEEVVKPELSKPWFFDIAPESNVAKWFL